MAWTVAASSSCWARVPAVAAAASPMISALEAFAAPPVGANDGILVMIMMDGGNDGLNTVVPTGESRYYQLRPGLAIPAASALPIGPGIGLHPSLVKLKARFDRGDVAVVQGVGYPSPDLSHFTSMGIWMNGWAGGAQPGGRDGVARPLPGRTAERGEREPVRRGDRHLGPAAHGRLGGAGERTPPEHRRRVRHRPA